MYLVANLCNLYYCKPHFFSIYQVLDTVFVYGTRVFLGRRSTERHVTNSSENTLAAAAAVSLCRSAPTPCDKCVPCDKRVVPCFGLLLCGLLCHSSASHTTSSPAHVVLMFACPTPINRRLSSVQMASFCGSLGAAFTFSCAPLGT